MIKATPQHLSRRRALGLALGSSALAALPVPAIAATTKSVPRTLGPISRRVVRYRSAEAVGTIEISNSDRLLHLVLGSGQAAEYDISVGRDGFLWTGVTIVGRKAKWPDWRPPQEMRERQPDLPAHVPPGPYNPLGARAIYLHSGGQDTLYRIHGTNNAASVGGFETSGCFRLSNADVLELYENVRTGAKVIVR